MGVFLVEGAIQMMLISACLAGEQVKYDGTDNLHPMARQLVKEGKAIPVCPEVLGGLPTPRIPAEIRGDSVLNRAADDVTKAFERGAEQTLALARHHQATTIILQERSPSCGVHHIYDGSFTNTLIEGEGKTTKRLREAGFEVLTITEWIEREHRQ
jgi:uncharacterized protein YbbK (DUF523 family)